MEIIMMDMIIKVVGVVLVVAACGLVWWLENGPDKAKKNTDENAVLSDGTEDAGKNVN
jgi:flagellar basal body-associated protein FliL